MDPYRSNLPFRLAKRLHIALCLGMVSLTMAPIDVSAEDLASLPAYRGDMGRTGVMPGPGPSGTPTVSWIYNAGGPFAASPTLLNGIVHIVSGDGVVHGIDFKLHDGAMMRTPESFLSLWGNMRKA